MGLFFRWLVLVVALSGCAGSSLPRDIHATLPEAHWLPAQSPRGQVLALHSFGDYHAAFRHIGPWLARRGYGVHSFDQRGFGGAPHPGHWAGTDLMVDDALRRARAIRATHGGPVYLLGESMGGAVAMLAAARAPEAVDGIILAAPAVREGIWIRYPYNAGLFVVAGLAPGATASVERDADNPLLRQDSARRLADDPKVIRQVRMDSYQGLIRLADRASDQAPTIRVPTMLLFGGRDEAIPRVSINHLRAHLDERVSWHFYPDAPHLLLQGHQWQRQACDILSWLDRNGSLTPRPGCAKQETMTNRQHGACHGPTDPDHRR